MSLYQRVTGAAARPRPLPMPPQLLLVVATLFWGGNFVVGRLVRQDITPIALTFWRWLLALAILLPLSAAEIRREWQVILAAWKLIFALGATGIMIYTLAFYEALRVTTAVNGALFLATLPMLIVLASWLINRERITRGQVLGLLISLGGAVVIVARGSLALLMALRFNAGDLWMLAALPFWAVYAVLQKHRPAALSPLTLVTASIAAATLMLAPTFLWEALHGGQTRLTTVSALGIGYTAVCASALSYVCWNRGAAVLGPNRAGVYINLIPVFSALLAVALLGERLARYHVVGAALVMCGIALAHRYGRAAPPR